MGLGASCRSWPKRLCAEDGVTSVDGEVDANTLYDNRTKRENLKTKLLYEPTEDNDDDDDAIRSDTETPTAHKDAKAALYSFGLDGHTMRTIMDIELKTPGPPSLVPDSAAIPAAVPSFDITDRHDASQSTASESSKSEKQIMSQYAHRQQHSLPMMEALSGHSLPTDSAPSVPLSVPSEVANEGSPEVRRRRLSNLSNPSNHSELSHRSNGSRRGSHRSTHSPEIP